MRFHTKRSYMYFLGNNNKGREDVPYRLFLSLRLYAASDNAMICKLNSYHSFSFESYSISTLNVT